jgi:hypothetical protein
LAIYKGLLIRAETPCFMSGAALLFLSDFSCDYFLCTNHCALTYPGSTCRSPEKLRAEKPSLIAQKPSFKHSFSVIIGIYFISCIMKIHTYVNLRTTSLSPHHQIIWSFDTFSCLLEKRIKRRYWSGSFCISCEMPAADT